MFPFLRRVTGATGAAVLVLAIGLAGCGTDAAEPERSGLWFVFPESALGREGPIRKVHVESGEEETLGDAGEYRHLAWAPNGNAVAAIRVQREPQLLVFDLGEDETYAVEIGVEDVQLSWSPDSTRLAVLSPGGVSLYTGELELLSSTGPPEEPIAPADYSPGMWSPDSATFAAYLDGYFMLLERVGRAHFFDPAGFVRYPGETTWITVMGWEAPHAVAIFEESERPSPRRYVLTPEGDEVDVLSSSDFEEGAGPFDGLKRQASEAAGGSEVVLGRSSAPPDLRWVVAGPGPGDVPVRVFVRHGDIFLTGGSELFGGADPEVLARDLSVMFVPPDDDQQ